MEAGQVILCIEGPHFTSRFAKMDFDLLSSEGMHVKGRSELFRARSSGISRVRMEIKSYQIPVPGRYLLRVLNPGTSREEDQEHRIVFEKPLQTQTIGYVVGIVLSSIACIGTIVLFLLRLLLNDAGT